MQNDKSQQIKNVKSQENPKTLQNPEKKVILFLCTWLHTLIIFLSETIWPSLSVKHCCMIERSCKPPPVYLAAYSDYLFYLKQFGHHFL